MTSALDLLRDRAEGCIPCAVDRQAELVQDGRGLRRCAGGGELLLELEDGGADLLDALMLRDDQQLVDLLRVNRRLLRRRGGLGSGRQLHRSEVADGHAEALEVGAGNVKCDLGPVVADAADRPDRGAVSYGHFVIQRWLVWRHAQRLSLQLAHLVFGQVDVDAASAPCTYSCSNSSMVPGSGWQRPTKARRSLRLTKSM